MIEIEIEVTEKRVLNVTLPYYTKNGSTFYKVVSESKAMKVYFNPIGAGMGSIEVTVSSYGVTYPQCTPEEFEAAYRGAMIQIAEYI